MNETNISEEKVEDGWEKQESSDFWKPDVEGETITGKVIRVGDGEYGKEYELDTKAGHVTLPAHKVLQKAMRLAVVGVEVKIVYKGQIAPKIRGQSPTEMYEVFFRK